MQKHIRALEDHDKEVCDAAIDALIEEGDIKKSIEKSKNWTLPGDSLYRQTAETFQGWLRLFLRTACHGNQKRIRI